jgi:hypothetical protein
MKGFLSEFQRRTNLMAFLETKLHTRFYEIKSSQGLTMECSANFIIKQMMRHFYKVICVEEKDFSIF